MPSQTSSQQKNFNAAQLKAITTDLKPAIVIAGAGTGKTSVLIHRIVHLIRYFDIDPQKIYVLTFTNQAINEIRHRLYNEKIELPNISTCHQICLELLRRRSKDFKILSDWEATKLWQRAIEKLNENLENHKIFKPYSLAGIYSAMKLKATSQGKDLIFETLSTALTESLSRSEFDFMSNEYDNHKSKNNVYDLNDLLTKCDEMLNDSVITEIQEYYHALLVDEFQDIDEIQFSIIKKLTKHGIHVFCVGDPDQSIYSFRGSDPKIFDKFKDNYPNCSIIKLEENYRSTPEILNVANKLINNNPSSEYQKILYTHNAHGEDVEFVYAQSESCSIDWIVQKIEKLALSGVAFGDIAILYRIKFHNIKIEQALTKQHIPNSILGSFKLTERPEIKHLISYMKLIYSNDSIAAENIINIPKRGIGKIAISKIHESAANSNLSFYENIWKMVHNAKEANKKTENIIKFVEQINEIKKLKDETDVKLITRRILEITNYLEHWPEAEQEKREKNIYKFVEEDVYTICTNQNKTIKDVIENIALLNSGDQKSKPKDSKVILSTIHQAKGLEFKYVFVINMNKGQIPYFKINGVENKPEERRIAYVAITRAKLKLFLCAFSETLLGDKDIHKYNQSEYISELASCLKKVSVTKSPKYRPNQNFKKFSNW